MKHSAIILSVVITTFILGIVGGVVKASSDNRDSAVVNELKAELQLRDEQYAQTISEANSRIEKANEMLAEVVKQKETAEQMLASIPTPEPKLMAISSDKAIELAMKAVHLDDSTISGRTELVKYNGQEAYEVKLANGNQFYLSAVTGEVLYNSVTGAPGAVIDEQGALFNAVVYLKGGRVVSVEKTTYEGKEAYLVTFETGEQVYVDLAGQVAAYVQVQTYPVYTNVSSGAKKSAKPNSDDHEDDHDEDHEDDHDDDHDDD